VSNDTVKDPIGTKADQEADHVGTASLLDTEGRRLAEAAVDHPAATSLRSAILQALGCLDRDVELSCSACSDLNRFVQLHRNGSADGSLDDSLRGLNWLLLRLSARDAVRSSSVAEWVRYIREHAIDVRLLELGEALDAGLRAAATGAQLDGRHRDAIVGWLTEPGVQRDAAYESAVQQILRQPNSADVVHHAIPSTRSTGLDRPEGVFISASAQVPADAILLMQPTGSDLDRQRIASRSERVISTVSTGDVEANWVVHDIKKAPWIRVFRDSFFAVPSHGSLRWTEASPESAHRHSFECGCTVNADRRPSGQPEQVRQEIRIVWEDCVIRIEDEVSCPWVTFRKAGDAETWIDRYASGEAEGDEDHTYFRFEDHEHSVSVAVTSLGFGLIGVVLTHVHLGNQIDTSRFFNGHSPSRVVDLGSIATDQVWIHGHPHEDAMRFLGDSGETAVLREVFQRASEVRRLARPHALGQTAPVDAVRVAVEADHALVGGATELRRLLRPFAFAIEGTELFRQAGEIEAEAEESRGRKRAR
jgi:hypothetical protein